MSFDPPDMLRHRFIWVFLAVLAAWTQLLAPVAVSAMEQPGDPFSVICGRTAGQQDKGPAPARHGHHHDCCVLCHADLGAGPLGERPAFTAFDYPVASSLRWQQPPAARQPRITRRRCLPRGPPSLV